MSGSAGQSPAPQAREKSGIIAYRGDDLTAATGVDPQTILADGSGTPQSIAANQTNPDTFNTGGAAEFELSNPG